MGSHRSATIANWASLHRPLTSTADSWLQTSTRGAEKSLPSRCSTACALIANTFSGGTNTPSTLSSTVVGGSSTRGGIRTHTSTHSLAGATARWIGSRSIACGAIRGLCTSARLQNHGSVSAPIPTLARSIAASIAPIGVAGGPSGQMTTGTNGGTSTIVRSKRSGRQTSAPSNSTFAANAAQHRASYENTAQWGAWGDAPVATHRWGVALGTRRPAGQAFFIAQPDG